jgi:hypothetical protein
MNTNNFAYASQSCSLPAGTHKMSYNWYVGVSTYSNLFTNCAMRVYFGNTLIDSFQPTQTVATFATRAFTFNLVAATTADLTLKVMVLSKPAAWAWSQRITVTSLTLAPIAVMQVGVVGRTPYTDGFANAQYALPSPIVDETGQTFVEDTYGFVTDWAVRGVNALHFRFAIPGASGVSNGNADPAGATTALGLRVNNLNAGNNACVYQQRTLPANSYTLTYNWVVNTGSPSLNQFPNCAMRVYFGDTLLDSFQPSQIANWTTRTVAFTVATDKTANLMLKLVVLSTGSPVFWSQTISITSLTLVGADTTWTGALNLTPNGNVGVLTDTPQYDLDVNGTMRVAGAATCAALTATTSLNSIATSVWASVAASAIDINIAYPIPRVVKASGVAGATYHIPAERDGYVVPSGAVVTIVAVSACVVVGSYTTNTGTNTVQTTALVSTYSQSLTAGTVADYVYYNDGVTGGLWCRCS